MRILHGPIGLREVYAGFVRPHNLHVCNRLLRAQRVHAFPCYVETGCGLMLRSHNSGGFDNLDFNVKIALNPTKKKKVSFHA